MTPTEIVEAVRGCGFDVVMGAGGPELKRTRTKACIPPDLMETLKRNRGELVLHLTRESEPETCANCGNYVYPGNGVTAEDIAACCLPPHRARCPYRTR